MVRAFQDAAQRFGLGYTVTDAPAKLTLPAFQDEPALSYATRPTR